MTKKLGPDGAGGDGGGGGPAEEEGAGEGDDDDMADDGDGCGAVEGWREDAALDETEGAALVVAFAVA